MKNEFRPVLAEPEIATYEKSELVVDAEYVVTGSGPPSSRRIKASFIRVDARRILRRLVTR
jgi:hypothetical protein